MAPIPYLFTLLLLFSIQLKAQVLPLERSSLNYRLIGFSFPAKEKTSTYRLEIAEGNISTDDSFRQSIIYSVADPGNKIIATVPAWGSSYTWRAVYLKKNKPFAHTPMYHFSTQLSPDVDTSLARLRIVDTATKYKDAYIFLDDNKAIYDMKGQPVWFMTKINGINLTPRDLKWTHQGTITFLFDPPCEIDYNCNVLFKPPTNAVVSKDYSEHYHHQFTRLLNGHYMALGEDSMLWDKGRPSIAHDTAAKKMQFGTLIEYDDSGKVAWSWKSSDYFSLSDLRGMLAPKDIKYGDVHENAFYFDEKNNYIYVSFRNINRIVKIKYPEGIVVRQYGAPEKIAAPLRDSSLFCGQHSCKYSGNGYLYLYNNNTCAINGLPKIVKLHEPATANEGLKKIWEYQCTTTGITNYHTQQDNYRSGGNVVELPDSSIFVCMTGGNYCKVFIVNPAQQEVWSAIPERWDTREKKWTIISQYRANIIYKKEDLARLIFKGEAYPRSAP